jgi:hypothetical protein
MVAVTGGQARATWLPPVDVSAPQSSVGCGFLCTIPGVAGVDVAVNSSGTVVASWARRDAANNLVVQAAIRPPGGSFGTPQDLGTTTGYFLGIFGPLIDAAIDDEGSAIVVWPTTRAGKTVIQASTRAPGGAFAGVVDLSDDSQSAGEPRVAVSGSGHAAVTWTRSDGANTIVQATTRAPGGSFPPTPLNLSAPGQDASGPRVDVNDDGAAIVSWLRSNGANTIVQARVRSSGDGAFAAVNDLSAAGQSAAAPESAISASGVGTVVWQRPDGTRTRIQSRFLTPVGGIGSGVDDLSGDTTNGSAPRVAVDRDNTAVAVWSGCPTGGGSCVVEAAARPSGGSFGAPQAISPPSDSNAFPTVVIDAGDTAVAAWADFGNARIKSAARPKGGAFGGVTDISPDAGVAFLPQLAADGEGSAVGGWAFIRPAPDNLQVAQAAIFDGAGPRFTSIEVPGESIPGRNLTMSAAATDRYSGATISWDFGDGTSASGPSVTHTYAQRLGFIVTVRAADGAGNTTTETRPVQVGKPRRIRSVVSSLWSFSGSRFTLIKLLVKRAPKGARAEVRCSGPGCPFKRKKGKRRHGNVDLRKAVSRKNHFRAGQTVEVRITKSGFIGKVVRYKLKAGKLPAGRTLCLPLGKTKPRRRC